VFGQKEGEQEGARRKSYQLGVLPGNKYLSSNNAERVTGSGPLGKGDFRDEDKRSLLEKGDKGAGRARKRSEVKS